MQHEEQKKPTKAQPDIVSNKQQQEATENQQEATEVVYVLFSPSKYHWVHSYAFVLLYIYIYNLNYVVTHTKKIEKKTVEKRKLN